MTTLEEQIMYEIKGQCILIRTDAMHLEGTTRNPDHTIEDIEKQLGEISELIGFLEDNINRYRVKKKAQSHHLTQVEDNQLTIDQTGCPAATEHPVASQQEIVIPASEEEARSDIKGHCIIIMTEAIRFEDMTKNPDLTVEQVEQKASEIRKLIGFLNGYNGYIEQYRRVRQGMRLKAQPRQAAQARDNQH